MFLSSTMFTIRYHHLNFVWEQTLQTSSKSIRNLNDDVLHTVKLFVGSRTLSKVFSRVSYERFHGWSFRLSLMRNRCKKSLWNLSSFLEVKKKRKQKTKSIKNQVWHQWSLVSDQFLRFAWQLICSCCRPCLRQIPILSIGRARPWR